MKKIIIIGAAGRDFHNFNTCYRNNPEYKVVAFTAAQIPDIDGRKYPAELAGAGYPDGIRRDAHTLGVFRCALGQVRFCKPSVNLNTNLFNLIPHQARRHKKHIAVKTGPGSFACCYCMLSTSQYHSAAVIKLELFAPQHPVMRSVQFVRYPFLFG